MYALVLLVVMGVQANGIEKTPMDWTVLSHTPLRDGLSLVECYKELNNEASSPRYERGQDRIMQTIYGFWPGPIDSRERREWDTILTCEARS